MKKSGVIFTVITFAVVWASQVKVDFTLRNNSIIRVTVPEGAFRKVYEQRILDSSHTENTNTSSSKNTMEEENVRVASCEFESEVEFEQFRQLWDTNTPALSTECNPLHQEQASHIADLSKDMFEKCLVTADYLCIRGEYAKRISENIVKYGLLGRHSADIMSSKTLSTYDLSQDTFWALLYTFLDLIGFEYRITHLCAQQTMLRIEKASAWPKQLNKEYAGPPQKARMRTVLYSQLAPTGTPEKERNEKVLAWLLLNMGGSSVGIHYHTDIGVLKEITGFYQLTQNITKANEKGTCVFVKGVTLSAKYDKIISLRPVLQLIPCISRLELINKKKILKSRELSSFISRDISSCRYLKVLTIQGVYLESADVSSLVESLPSIMQLSLSCKHLEDTAIESLKKYCQLKKLVIYEGEQPSATLQTILTQLSSLKELSISCQSLKPAEVEAFQGCTQLEKLEMRGAPQPSAAVQAIVSHLPSLKELSINCQSLELAAAEVFQACPQLERLKIDERFSSCQSSAIVQALLRHLPSLKELAIPCYTLSTAAIEAFQACPQVEKLEIIGGHQSSAAVQALLRHFSSLKELSINCQSLKPAEVEAFQGCTRLERLEMSGYSQPSAAVQALLRHFSSLKELSIECKLLDTTDAEVFQECTQLEKLKIWGATQSSATAQAIVTHCPSLKELIIEIDTPEFDLADALRNYPTLCSLNLSVSEYKKGFLARYLQNPLPRVAVLSIYNYNDFKSGNKEDEKAVENAKNEGMVIDLDNIQCY
ncbi:hypothetical protein NECID01_1420 [Nematocida sp. AWRm77]|nr:hypothetical protein NECID01_1420 [Nematocida sp. AWRm77]